MKMCENYLLLSHKGDIIRILEHAEKDKYFAVNINFLELFDSDTNLGNALLTDPNVAIANWNRAAFNVQTELLKSLANNYSPKNNVNCRIYNLPPWPHVSRTIFPGNDDANKFLQVTGTVVRMSARKLLEHQRQYVCVKCKYPITVKARYDKNNIIKQPKKCLNPEGCGGKNIITFGELDTYNCKDYQEINIQEDLSKLGVGTVPNHMVVTLEDELVNVCKPGENVTITGVVTRRWSEFDKGAKIVIDIALKANHIQINNSSGAAMAVADETLQFFDGFWQRHVNNPLVGRNVILESISPEICGLHLVKLAIAIVLAGGSQSEDMYTSTGIDTRAESHLLLVGDPGTGKSNFMRFASKIIPRSVLTTGIGSTAAGLTVTAVMENGEWQLEAGALVMADGGICCIDEFNSMREHDRTSIHEAMEQQTISVAKAGMICKLKTRCSILAACNPKGNVNPLKPLCLNVAMSSPLLSRFDLIFLLRDIVNEDNDRKLAEHLLNKGRQLSGDEAVWSLDKLQSYYAVIKKKNPKLTGDSETILSTYYQLQRRFGSRNKSRTTVRLLESLIRLSQGHAKLMYHSEVQVMDAIFAVTLIDAAMDVESSILNLKIDNNAYFDGPDRLYCDQLESILGKLNLDHICQKEIAKADVPARPRSLFAKKMQKTLGSSQSEETSPKVEQNSVFDRSLFAQSLRLSQESGNKETGPNNRPRSLFTKRTQISQESDVNSSYASVNRPFGLFIKNKTIDASKDSGHFSDMTSKISLNETAENEQLNKSNLSGNDTKENTFPHASRKCAQSFETKNMPGNSTNIEDEDLDLWFHSLLSSRDKKTPNEGSNKATVPEIFTAKESKSSNLDRPATSKESSCTGITSNNNQLDPDLDSWFDNMQKNINNKRKQSELNAETIKSRSKVPEGNCNALASGESKKRQTNSSKSSNKKRKESEKIENEVDVLKLMPSVNDDFGKFGLEIDWDMEENARGNSQANSDDDRACNEEIVNKINTNVLNEENALSGTVLKSPRKFKFHWISNKDDTCTKPVRESHLDNSRLIIEERDKIGLQETSRKQAFKSLLNQFVFSKVVVDERAIRKD